MQRSRHLLDKLRQRFAPMLCRTAGSISRCTGSSISGKRHCRLRFSVAPRMAVPMAEPTMRVNTVQAVAMPRML